VKRSPPSRREAVLDVVVEQRVEGADRGERVPRGRANSANRSLNCARSFHGSGARRAAFSVRKQYVRPLADGNDAEPPPATPELPGVRGEVPSTTKRQHV
jgi:hypothetical protein